MIGNESSRPECECMSMDKILMQCAAPGVSPGEGN